jgi:hypothetical protein
MDRPLRFEHNRFLGDKRTQVVYDLDAEFPQSVLDELVASEQVASFGPDTLAEARNRGYRPYGGTAATVGAGPAADTTSEPA